ncbi:hypothetical protein LXL04_003715 [Taraxacum kok-saghyz]
MEIDEESEEEDEMDDQVQEERDDEGPDYKTDDGEDLIVKNGNYPERPMNDPTTPVSFRTFRHPGGRLWNRTPRKSVPQPRGPSTTEAGETSRPSLPSATDNDLSTSTIAGLEKRIEYLQAKLAMALRQTERMAGQNHVTGVRARVLEEYRDIDHVTITAIRTDLVEARARLTDVETQIAGLQEQIDATDTLALRAEGRSIDAIQGVENIKDMIEGRHGFW